MALARVGIGEGYSLKGSEGLFGVAADLKTLVPNVVKSHVFAADELLGRSPDAESAANPRTRRVSETARFTGYEVVLEVYPEVFAYGILLVPKGIRRGERRPVVVCQHGLEGRPQDTADPSIENNTYNQFACRLAERGFVTFAPQNPYIGEGKFRVLVRKSHPLKQSLYSVIVRQHECVLRWLAGLAFGIPRASRSTDSAMAARRP